MAYCMHCGTELHTGDRFCAGCGEAAVFPGSSKIPKGTKRSVNPELAADEFRKPRAQEKKEADAYYQEVGSRHPHIWPVTGLGSAFYLVCIGAMGLFFFFVVGGEVPELRRDSEMRLMISALMAALMWIPLTAFRYLFYPIVRPGQNPEMMGSKGDFWVFLLGAPLIILAIIGWLSAD